MALINTKKLPRAVFEEKSNSFPASNSKAPEAPSAIPNALNQVNFSFLDRMAIIMTRIGVVTIIKEAFTGVLKLNPLKNISWLSATPNIPQKNKRK